MSGELSLARLRARGRRRVYPRVTGGNRCQKCGQPPCSVAEGLRVYPVP